MGRMNWAQAAVFGLVALLVVLVATSMMSPWAGWSGDGGIMGRGGMMGAGGMMGGWGLLGWFPMLLVPITLVAVFVLGIAWLARQAWQPPPGSGPPSTAIPCRHCGQFVQASWRACPYCGGALVSDGPPDAASS